MKSGYTIRRRMIQGISLFFLASIPLRLFCVDLDQETLRSFGSDFGYATMFYPLFGILALLLFVGYLSMKKGRIFCSHMCPMHMLLEVVNQPRLRKTKKRGWVVGVFACAFSFLLSQVILSFFLPLSDQFERIAAGQLSLMGVGAALMAGFMVLFGFYQEQFCKRGCPYAMIQMLLQSDRTRTMQFDNSHRACTNCRKCENSCPSNLRARSQSSSSDCTNCNLCAEACTSELGKGNALFHLVDPPRPEPAVLQS